MDTSEKYIKMCEKAEEIQQEREYIKDDIAVITYWDDDEGGEIKEVFTLFEVSNVLVFKEEEGFPIDILEDQFLNVSYYGKNNIWLPRQDQLQEMITEEIVARYIKLTLISTSIFYNRFKALDLWIDKLSAEKNHYADKLIEFSGEQLWLAFVMKEKYNKILDGDEWINL